MDLPSEDEFESRKPSGLVNWEFEQEYESSFRVVNVDTGEHVQAMVDTDREQVHLTPMLSQGMGYSSAQSQSATHDMSDTDKIIDSVWSLARQIKSGDITRDDSDFTL